jgi:hypothetical protein
MTGTDDSPVPTQADFDRVRRSRNKVLGLLLGAFVVLVFAISIVKMTH